MTNGKRHTPSHTEHLSNHLLGLITANPGIATLALYNQYTDQHGPLRDGRGYHLYDAKKAQARLRTVLSDMRTKGKIWDRQGANNAQYWYAADYRQGPRLQPTLGPPSKPPEPAPTPAPVPPTAPTARPYTLHLEPTRAALTAEALHRLAPLLADDIAALIHPLIEALNPQEEVTP